MQNDNRGIEEFHIKLQTENLWFYSRRFKQKIVYIIVEILRWNKVE